MMLPNSFLIWCCPHGEFGNILIIRNCNITLETATTDRNVNVKRISMILNHSTVSVQDLDQAVKWYKEVLEFTTVKEAGDWFPTELHHEISVYRKLGYWFVEGNND